MKPLNSAIEASSAKISKPSTSPPVLSQSHELTRKLEDLNVETLSQVDLHELKWNLAPADCGYSPKQLVLSDKDNETVLFHVVGVIASTYFGNSEYSTNSLVLVQENAGKDVWNSWVKTLKGVQEMRPAQTVLE